MTLQPVRAAVAGDNGRPFRMASLELEAPRPEEVLVRLVACGICHTDVGMTAGCAAPTVFGHEGAGIVEQVGANVSRLAPGDPVVLSFDSCGNCSACRAGMPAACDHFMAANFSCARLDGSNALSDGVNGHFFGQSSFATYALASTRNAIRVDRDLPLDVLAPLGCGLQTGAGTVVHSLSIGEDKSLVITGAGAVGLGALMAAKRVGARPLIVVEPVEERRELALALGADYALTPENALEGGIAERLADGASFLIDTAGDSAVFQAIPDWLTDDGQVAYLTGAEGGGLKPSQSGRSVIQGDADPQQFIPQMIEWYRAGEFPVDRLVTRYAFEDIDRAYADAAASRVIKAVLVMG
ncbi:NAD(P)-dependent alcohol dehydrogenase [Marinobacter nanhaiticus D15-8W]|uniref:NAD(P)-dependent alcohol dehydrogenase n=1 Tax=Marinobacter nanhaiticus D15-8W TaxID=626887 RepID=N6W4Z0_9GAMM|nr:NAD(P)-dependent alcohol dehydrogenase [Marinobacter nanhaiticus]ENO15219.1 NAD(P)-dependent alcohol dehydrogenase [Marinobacter nanhaiticus D15-8W]BES69079.1 NAD(P)-dependent alcohol dehydrogenase [Marinobacter nanhaiticus D15-8W]